MHQCNYGQILHAYVIQAFKRSEERNSSERMNKGRIKVRTSPIISRPKIYLVSAFSYIRSLNTANSEQLNYIFVVVAIKNTDISPKNNGIHTSSG